MLDIVSVMVGLLGVCVSIVVPLLEYMRTRYKSEFYAYLLISQSELAAQYRLAGLVFSFVAIGLYCIVSFDGVFYDLLIISNDRTMKAAFALVFALFAIATMTFKQVFAFQKSDRLEKHLKRESYVYHKVKSVFNSALILICLGVVILLSYFGVSDSPTALILLGLIATSVQGVYCSYVYVYMQLHLRFYVYRMNIKVDNIENCYHDVANFICKKDMLSFTVLGDSEVKNITVLKCNIGYIERILDTNENMLGAISKLEQ